MTAQAIRILYLLFFVAEFLWERFLTILNLNHVQKSSTAVPAALEHAIGYEQYQTSAVYTRTKGTFSLVTSTISAAFLLTLILTGMLGVLDNWITGFRLHAFIHGILYVLLLSMIFRLFSIPFSLYAQFVIEERFGFNKMSIGLYFVDLAKGLLISVVLMVPLLLGLFWFMNKAGDWWWLYAFGFLTVIQFVMSVLYPLVIAPIFNKFAPLEESSLKTKIEELAHRLSFRTKGIFVMDGSKRSKHSNAYFTGLGRIKRIVLFDTLLENHQEDQIAAVLAHEIGHEKKRHTIKMLIVTLVLGLASFYVLHLLIGYEPLYRAFGFTTTSYHAILIILGFCSGPFTFFFSPLFSVWSRKHEYEADRFAVDAMGEPQSMKDALIKIEQDNLSNLTPHPLFSFYHYSHPTLIERIKAIEERN